MGARERWEGGARPGAQQWQRGGDERRTSGGRSIHLLDLEDFSRCAPLDGLLLRRRLLLTSWRHLVSIQALPRAAARYSTQNLALLSQLLR